MVTTNRGEDEFREFMADAEPRLRRSLVAAYGPERGREAAAEALAYGWEHWNRVRRMASPVGYLYRVGQSRTRPRKVRTLIERHSVSEVWCEPGLPSALAALPERQRVVVVLVHGFGWTLAEVADLLGLRKTSVQNHLERAMARLRADLEEPVDERA
jgi:RNA polymerase sigma factor, sigma-70 family